MFSPPPSSSSSGPAPGGFAMNDPKFLESQVKRLKKVTDRPVHPSQRPANKETVTALVEAIKTKPKFTKMVQYSMMCLKNLASSESAVEEMLDLDVLKAVDQVQKVNPYNEGIQQIVCDTITSFAKTDKLAASVAERIQPERLMFSLERHVQPATIAATCRATARLLQSPVIVGHFVSSGLLGALKKAMKNQEENAEVVEAATECLVRTADVSQYVPMMVQTGVISDTVQAFKHFPENAKFVQRGLALITKISTVDPSAVGQLKKIEGSMDTLVSAIESHPSNVNIAKLGGETLKHFTTQEDLKSAFQVPVTNSAESAEALSKLSTLLLVQENSDYLVQNHGIDHFIGSLQAALTDRSDTAASIAVSSLKGLMRLATDENKIYAIMQQGGIKLVIRVLKELTTDESMVLAAANFIAKLLTRQENMVYILKSGLFPALSTAFSVHKSCNALAKSVLDILESLARFPDPIKFALQKEATKSIVDLISEYSTQSDEFGVELLLQLTKFVSKVLDIAPEAIEMLGQLNAVKHLTQILLNDALALNSSALSDQSSAAESAVAASAQPLITALPSLLNRFTASPSAKQYFSAASGTTAVALHSILAKDEIDAQTRRCCENLNGYLARTDGVHLKKASEAIKHLLLSNVQRLNAPGAMGQLQAKNSILLATTGKASLVTPSQSSLMRKKTADSASGPFYSPNMMKNMAFTAIQPAAPAPEDVAAPPPPPVDAEETAQDDMGDLLEAVRAVEDLSLVEANGRDLVESGAVDNLTAAFTFAVLQPPSAERHGVLASAAASLVKLQKMSESASLKVLEAGAATGILKAALSDSTNSELAEHAVELSSSITANPKNVALFIADNAAGLQDLIKLAQNYSSNDKIVASVTDSLDHITVTASSNPNSARVLPKTEIADICTTSMLMNLESPELFSSALNTFNRADGQDDDRALEAILEAIRFHYEKSDVLQLCLQSLCRLLVFGESAQNIVKKGGLAICVKLLRDQWRDESVVASTMFLLQSLLAANPRENGLKLLDPALGCIDLFKWMGNKNANNPAIAAPLAQIMETIEMLQGNSGAVATKATPPPPPPAAAAAVPAPTPAHTAAAPIVIPGKAAAHAPLSPGAGVSRASTAAPIPVPVQLAPVSQLPPPGSLPARSHAQRTAAPYELSATEADSLSQSLTVESLEYLVNASASSGNCRLLLQRGIISNLLHVASSSFESNQPQMAFAAVSALAAMVESSIELLVPSKAKELGLKESLVSAGSPAATLNLLQSPAIAQMVPFDLAQLIALFHRLIVLIPATLKQFLQRNPGTILDQLFALLPRAPLDLAPPLIYLCNELSGYSEIEAVLSERLFSGSGAVLRTFLLVARENLGSDKLIEALVSMVANLVNGEEELNAQQKAVAIRSGLVEVLLNDILPFHSSVATILDQSMQVLSALAQSSDPSVFLHWIAGTHLNGLEQLVLTFSAVTATGSAVDESVVENFLLTFLYLTQTCAESFKQFFAASFNQFLAIQKNGGSEKGFAVQLLAFLTDAILNNLNSLVILKLSMRVMAALAYSEPIIHQAIVTGGVQAIVAALTIHSSTIDLAQGAIMLLGKLAAYATKEETMKILAEEGAPQAVVEILSMQTKALTSGQKNPKQLELMVAALNCLSGLARRNDTAAILIKQFVVESVVSVLDSLTPADAPVCVAAVRLVMALAKVKQAELIDRILESRIVASLVQTIRNHSNNPNVMSVILLALSLLASSADNAQKVVAQFPGCIQWLLDSLNSNINNPRQCNDYFPVLSALSRHDAFALEIAQSAIAFIVQCCRVYAADPRFLCSCLSLAGNLAIHRPVCELICQTPLVSDTIRLIHQYTNDVQLVVRALRVLENLALCPSRSVMDTLKSVDLIGVINNLTETKRPPEIARACTSVQKAIRKTDAEEARKLRTFNMGGNADRIRMLMDEEGDKRGDDTIEFPMWAKNLLLAGELLIKHSNSAAPRPRHVFLADDFSALRWKDPKKGFSTDNQMRIFKIRNIAKGRTTPQLQRSRFGKFLAKEECSFSIIGRDRSVDLEAKTEKDRDRWVEALELLVLHQKALKEANDQIAFDDDDDDRDKEEAKSAPKPVAPAAPASPVMTPASPPAGAMPHRRMRSQAELQAIFN